VRCLDAETGKLIWKLLLQVHQAGIDNNLRLYTKSSYIFFGTGKHATNESELKEKTEWLLAHQDIPGFLKTMNRCWWHGFKYG